MVLDMPLLNTHQERDLTGRLIADIVLQLLSYVAQTERDFIRTRQAEGIAAAKARGVRFGAKPLPRPENYLQVLAQWQQADSWVFVTKPFYAGLTPKKLQMLWMFK